MKFNGAGARRVNSWIEEFTKSTEPLETPKIFRRWAGISTIAAVLEQKVWMQTSTELFPNIYTILVSGPGLGKTRTINAATAYLREIPEFHIAPTSLTSASLVDALMESKRLLIRLPDEPLEYNSMLIAADEIGAFMHHEDKQIFDILSAFYVPFPYGQDRRGRDIKIKMKRPQVNILAGATPTVLMKLLPDAAWEQGFCSRLMLIYSDEQIISDDAFHRIETPFESDLLHDLKIMNTMHGLFEATSDYRNAVNAWRHSEDKGPQHPKLVHYNVRRMAHLLKLTMISAIDRSNVLLLTIEDFKQGMAWLVEAEHYMLGVFKAGGMTPDSKAMDEIHHFVATMDQGRGVSESRVFNFGRERVNANTLERVIGIMMRSGLLVQKAIDKDGNRWFKAGKTEDD
jgi:hypothetical protein